MSVNSGLGRSLTFTQFSNVSQTLALSREGPNTALRPIAVAEPPKARIVQVLLELEGFDAQAPRPATVPGDRRSGQVNTMFFGGRLTGGIYLSTHFYLGFTKVVYGTLYLLV